MDGLTFADKFLRLVTTGDHNSTYKMATAVALLQAAQEVSDETANAVLTGRLAEIVIEVYSLQLDTRLGIAIRQMNRVDKNSRLLEAIASLRTGCPRRWPRLQRSAPNYAAVVDEVERVLLAYPLRLLQAPGDRFLYAVPHPERKSSKAFGADVTGSLVLHDGILSLLRRAAPLVRPLIEAEWTRKVARYNALTLDESHLRRRLFGYDRTDSRQDLRLALEDLQTGCFYCGRPLPRGTVLESGQGRTRARAQTHIDHFIPWSRSMNDAIENLVLADESCNLRKSDNLCSVELVRRWVDRLRASHPDLERAADRLRWPSELARTVRSAIAQYDHCGRGELVPVWTGTSVVAADVKLAVRELEQLAADVLP